MWVQSLGQEDPVEKEMATHSIIPAWEIPWTEEPGDYGGQEVDVIKVTEHLHMCVCACTHTHTHTQLKQVILFEYFFVFWLLLYSFFPLKQNNQFISNSLPFFGLQPSGFCITEIALGKISK